MWYADQAFLTRAEAERIGKASTRVALAKTGLAGWGTIRIPPETPIVIPWPHHRRPWAFGNWLEVVVVATCPQ
jgi:hypothetical protein